MEQIDYNKIQPIIDLHPVIQGEGRFMGVPHILIRFSGCNLNCMFSDSICDTSYASWNPEKGQYSLNDVEKIIEQNPQIHCVFITGGEPTIHEQLLKEVLVICKDKYTSIETNGTHYVPGLNGNLNFVSISPKLSNSTPILGTHVKNDYVDKIVTNADIIRHEKNRKNYESMGMWIAKYDYQVKFVISTEEQLEEAEYIIDLLNINPLSVYLMPEGISNEQLQKRRPWLFELCISRGYNYSDRLHVIAFDNKRIA